MGLHKAPFNSKTFSDYCEFMGIQHNNISHYPLHPQTNGLVDKQSSAYFFNSRKCWKQELFKFLRNYRVTPHTTTGKSPADLLFQTRLYRVRIPELSTSHSSDNKVRERDAEKKLQAKQYADRKSYVKCW
ncbi:Transposon Ty3-I Gag-Pol poly [Paramuricea clavata]|uniref:Transposon Ty3-I Gag-Pol poly n=1 Tax=Paramuricea clavata TaxID=317549 RepID=A0A7D9EK36_PARCT|nr:Transposon Ty3-I Gag-Pol poly [Paramuricea clavata]